MFDMVVVELRVGGQATPRDSIRINDCWHNRIVPHKVQYEIHAVRLKE